MTTGGVEDCLQQAAGLGPVRDGLRGWGPLVTGCGAETCRLWGWGLLMTGCGAGAHLPWAVVPTPACDGLWAGSRLPSAGSGRCCGGWGRWENVGVAYFKMPAET